MPAILGNSKGNIRVIVTPCNVPRESMCTSLFELEVNVMQAEPAKYVREGNGRCKANVPKVKRSIALCRSSVLGECDVAFPMQTSR